MAASHIPNLNTLRNSNRPGPASNRTRGNLASASSSSVEDGRLAKDMVVQHTDQDASVSRLSAVEVGYLDDPFAKLFVTAGEQRRFPIINRGMSLRLQTSRFSTSLTDEKVHMSAPQLSTTSYIAFYRTPPSRKSRSYH